VIKVVALGGDQRGDLKAIRRLSLYSYSSMKATPRTNDAWPPSTMESHNTLAQVQTKAIAGCSSDESWVCLLKIRPITVKVKKIRMPFE
jgi:hypothetical protein